MPKISIITPVYNVSEYLEECINSIIDQTHQDWELILVDDGSQDNSGMICDKYANQDNRIICIHKQNGGQSSARNIALEKARGEFLMFVDADDVLLDNNTLGHVLQYITEHADVDIVQFPFKRFFGNIPSVSTFENCRTISTLKVLKSKKDYIEHTDILNSVSSTSVVLKTSPWGKVYRSSLFKSIRFLEGMVYEDTFMFCDLFDVVGSIALVNCGLYGNRERTDSTTGSAPTKERMQDKITAFRKIMQFLMLNSDSIQLKRKYYIWILNLVASFKASFGNSFVRDEDIKDIEQYAYCLKNGGMVDSLVFLINPNRYIDIRCQYYRVKSKVFNCLR